MDWAAQAEAGLEEAGSGLGAAAGWGWEAKGWAAAGWAAGAAGVGRGEEQGQGMARAAATEE